MLGRLDGENAVRQGDGFMIGKLKEYFNNATVRAEYSSAAKYISQMAKSQAKYYARMRKDE
jgi:hypothetical protein